MISEGSGKLKVFLKRIQHDDELILLLGGGEKSHVGCFIVCTPGEKTQLFILGTHKDHVVLKPIAEAACVKYDKKIIALGGIHIDDATKEEIDTIVQNCKKLIDRI